MLEVFAYRKRKDMHRLRRSKMKLVVFQDLEYGRATKNTCGSRVLEVRPQHSELVTRLEVNFQDFREGSLSFMESAQKNKEQPLQILFQSTMTYIQEVLS